MAGRRHHEATSGSGEDTYALLTFEFHEEGPYWVGACCEVGTATDGRSFEKVAQELGRLVALHLKGLEDIGERERLFRERGIEVFTGQAPAEVERKLQVVGDGGPLLQLKSILLTLRPGQPIAV